MEDNVVGEKDEHKEIGSCGFDFKLFPEEKGGDFHEGIYGYPYLKHLLELWTSDWIEHLSKINERVSDINRYQKAMGKIILVQIN